MGENFDETTIHSGKKPTKRNRERAIVEIVRRITLESGKAANLNDVLTEAGRLDISQDIAMDIIDALVTDWSINASTRLRNTTTCLIRCFISEIFQASIWSLAVM